MKIRICDDDPMVSGALKSYLVEYFQSVGFTIGFTMPNIEIFQDPLLLASTHNSYDLAFLDIEMPDCNGIDLIPFLRKHNRSVIIFIITSYSNYLDDAMRANVFRYLSKPLEKERLFRNLDDAIAVISSAHSTLLIHAQSQTISIDVSDILFIEKVGHTAFIHTTAATYETSDTLQSYIEALPPLMFFHAHKSYVVGFTHITSFDSATVYYGRFSSQAYLSRRKYKAFKQAYMLFLSATS